MLGAGGPKIVRTWIEVAPKKGAAKEAAPKKGAAKKAPAKKGAAKKG